MLSREEFVGRDGEATRLPAASFSLGLRERVPAPRDGRRRRGLPPDEVTPSLDCAGGRWRVRPVAELHATNDKAQFHLDTSQTAGGRCTRASHSTFGRQTRAATTEASTRASFRSWRSGAVEQRGTSPLRFRRAERDQQRLDPSELHARIDWRDTRDRLQRTVMAALVPPRVALTHGAPYLFRVAAQRMTPMSSESWLRFPSTGWPAGAVEMNVTYEHARCVRSATSAHFGERRASDWSDRRDGCSVTPAGRARRVVTSGPGR